ncbi:copper resistance protein NlpE [Microvirga lenta]|uniref:copper resistance protein NlpE n=1 Tax=Microvirga lenta TaxID=2881337 RepID=UPI001CFFF0A9|nr:copper resistance protein NlpE [Microvirga lenta]MCB5177524.1 copper resistance protein NlpE [Microvirga lenta]
MAGTNAADDVPGTTGTATATPPAGSTQTAATSATNLDTFQGRTYSAGPVSLQLNPDNTFVMNEVDGNKKVEGRYAYENGVLTLSDPKGDVGQATFPMRCRFETSGASDFRLADNEGACTRFRDLTFKPAAG